MLKANTREMESDGQYMVNRALAGMRRKDPAPCKPERPACKVIPFPMDGRDADGKTAGPVRSRS
jgi:hypothetical protein